MLTTSREPLALIGEAICPLPPLTQPPVTADALEAAGFPAVQLWLDRARVVRPDFVLDAETVGPVIEIVRRLDGLPLAIELAAARLRVLPAAEIAHRLSDRFRLLTGGNRPGFPAIAPCVPWSSGAGTCSRPRNGCWPNGWPSFPPVPIRPARP